MPHFVVEYTSNIENEFELDVLFEQVHTCLIAMNKFPTGGIRSRARCVDNYRFADGKGDYAGIHINLKLSAIRTKPERIKIAKKISKIVKDFFIPLSAKRLLALSMEVSLFTEGEFLNHNNLHQHFGDDYPSTM